MKTDKCNIIEGDQTLISQASILKSISGNPLNKEEKKE